MTVGRGFRDRGIVTGWTPQIGSNRRTGPGRGTASRAACGRPHRHTGGHRLHGFAQSDVFAAFGLANGEAAFLVADKLHRIHQHLEVNAFVLGVVDFLHTRGHLVLGAAIVDAGRSWRPGATRCAPHPWRCCRRRPRSRRGLCRDKAAHRIRGNDRRASGSRGSEIRWPNTRR